MTEKTITITVAGPAKVGKSRIIESISNALKTYEFAATKQEKLGDADLVVMAREYDGLIVEIHEKRLSSRIEDGAITAQPLPGLHPANTASMDMRTRQAMLDRNWPWPRMLPLKKRTNPMVFGYIQGPVADENSEVNITVQSGEEDEGFDTIDDALRAGWTVD